VRDPPLFHGSIERTLLTERLKVVAQGEIEAAPSIKHKCVRRVPANYVHVLGECCERQVLLASDFLY